MTSLTPASGWRPDAALQHDRREGQVATSSVPTGRCQHGRGGSAPNSAELGPAPRFPSRPRSASRSGAPDRWSAP